MWWGLCCKQHLIQLALINQINIIKYKKIDNSCSKCSESVQNSFIYVKREFTLATGRFSTNETTAFYLHSNTLFILDSRMKSRWNIIVKQMYANSTLKTLKIGTKISFLRAILSPSEHQIDTLFRFEIIKLVRSMRPKI